MPTARCSSSSVAHGLKAFSAVQAALQQAVIAPSPEAPIAAQLPIAAQFARRDILIVLDTAEHVLEQLSTLTDDIFRAGPRVRLHDLRHSHATIALAAGTDLKTISAALGHSTISVTANTYLHAVESLAAFARRADRRGAWERCRAGFGRAGCCWGGTLGTTTAR